MPYWMISCVDCGCKIMIPRGTETGRVRCYKCKSEHNIRMARARAFLAERKAHRELMSKLQSEDGWDL